MRANEREMVWLGWEMDGCGWVQAVDGKGREGKGRQGKAAGGNG